MAISYFLQSTVSPLPTCSSQQKSDFRLQNDGSFCQSDGSRQYVVTSLKSKKELYKKAMRNIMELFVSPKDVVNCVENEIITISGVIINTCALKRIFGYKLLGYYHYSIVFQFRDGEIVVDAPFVSYASLPFFDANKDTAIEKFLEKYNVMTFGKLPRKNKGIDELNNVLNEIIANITNMDTPVNCRY